MQQSVMGHRYGAPGGGRWDFLHTCLFLDTVVGSTGLRRCYCRWEGGGDSPWTHGGWVNEDDASEATLLQVSSVDAATRMSQVGGNLHGRDEHDELRDLGYRIYGNVFYIPSIP